MANITQFSAEEAPTKQVEPVTRKTLALVSRADRLAELALERLRSGDDRDSIAATIVQLQALLAGVIR